MADGVTTAMLGLFASIEGTPAEKRNFVEGLVRECSAGVRAAGDEADKVAIAAEVIRRHRDRLDVDGARRAIPIETWVGREAAARAREELLAWVAPKARFQPRRAPRVGGLIRVQVADQARHPACSEVEDRQDDLG